MLDTLPDSRSTGYTLDPALVPFFPKLRGSALLVSIIPILVFCVHSLVICSQSSYLIAQELVDKLAQIRLSIFDFLLLGRGSIVQRASHSQEQ